jgi:nicotinamide mononucleotide transporter
MNTDSMTYELPHWLPASSAWELVAVVLAIAYVLLAMKERIECWYAAFLSTAIYIFLFWNVDLLMESALQVYYLAMAVFGWYQWRHVGSEEAPLAIHTWPIKTHCLAIAGVFMISLLSGFLLENNTQAALPYLDSLTTWGAVLATFMVTRKILENWLYWVVIDFVSIFLYVDRGLYPTVGLFVIYTIIAFFGYLQWQKTYHGQQPALNPS